MTCINSCSQIIGVIMHGKNDHDGKLISSTYLEVKYILGSFLLEMYYW